MPRGRAARMGCIRAPSEARPNRRWSSTTRAVRERSCHVAVAQVAAIAGPVRAHGSDLIGIQRGLRGLRIQLVMARGIAGENRALHRTVGGTERPEAVFLLHVFGYLEP